MSRLPAHASPQAGIDLKWLALSAAVGGVGMWFLLTHGADRNAVSPAPDRTAPAVRAGFAPELAPATASTWPTASAPTASANGATSPAPAALRRDDTALPSPDLGPPLGDPADYALDDATLSRRARTQFGLDCPGIVDRRARRSGRFEVICSNGLRLRVNLMGDGPPGISAIDGAAAPVRVRSSSATSPEDRE